MLIKMGLIHLAKGFFIRDGIQYSFSNDTLWGKMSAFQFLSHSKSVFEIVFLLHCRRSDKCSKLGEKKNCYHLQKWKILFIQLIPKKFIRKNEEQCCCFVLNVRLFYRNERWMVNGDQHLS